MMSKETTDTTLEAQAERLGDLLWRLVRIQRALDASEQVCCGVTLSQCYALLAFDGREEMAMAELSSHLGLAVSTATRLVDSLIRQDLAERRRPADDRRTVLVRLTRTGRERMEVIQSGRRQMLAQVLSGIPAERRNDVIEILGQLLGALVPSDCRCSEAP